MPTRRFSEELFDEAHLDDVRMKSDSDVEMDIAEEPPTRPLAERQAYAQAQRDERDALLTRLEDIWDRLRSDPVPGANLITQSDFDDYTYGYLSKGPDFPALARRLGGLSAASKAVRHQLRKKGKAFTPTDETIFDTIMAYNRRVLAMPQSRPAPQSSRRSHLL